MKQEKPQADGNMSKDIEDLTLAETKTDDVKGGASKDWFVADSFSFGVEREMK